ncbi:MAG: IS66 family transposase [Verrucomicrobiales bacterium]|nr:IS66 family transposase [Verrucomicrobiales bacterium]
MTEFEQIKADNELLREENRLLRQKLDYVIRQLYGAKSERIDPNQLELFDDLDTPGKDEASDADDQAAEALIEAEKSSRPKSGKERKPGIPDHLPVEEIIIEPDPVKACPEAWRRIGEEISEELDYQPGRFLCRRTIRPKYVKNASPEAAPIVAKLPEKLLERGKLAPGLLAHLAVSKYADHLPLYRQEQIFKQRYQVELSRQTMSNGVKLVAEWLRPVVRVMAAELFSDGYVQVDETPIRYLAPGKGKTAQGYFWTSHRPGGDTVYQWHTGRGHQCLEEVVPHDFAGIIQCDAYRAYPAFTSKRDGVGLAGCWAHARRKFHDAFQQGDSKPRATRILREIGSLYDIERELRESRAGPELRKTVRRDRSRPIVKSIKNKLIEYRQSGNHLPKSLFGRAISYALEQWELLTVYLDHGRVEIDNNLCENAIRPTAVGKKNWMFIGDKEAGWRSAVIYSIITSCRDRGIDPLEYLRDVLTRLPSMTNHQIPEITPAAWLRHREQENSLSVAS